MSKVANRVAHLRKLLAKLDAMVNDSGSNTSDRVMLRALDLFVRCRAYTDAECDQAGAAEPLIRAYRACFPARERFSGSGALLIRMFEEWFRQADSLIDLGASAAAADRSKARQLIEDCLAVANTIQFLPSEPESRVRGLVEALADSMPTAPELLECCADIAVDRLHLESPNRISGGLGMRVIDGLLTAQAIARGMRREAHDASAPAPDDYVIVLLERDADILETLKEILEAEGYAVISARSPSAALEEALRLGPGTKIGYVGVSFAEIERLLRSDNRWGSLTLVREYAEDRLGSSQFAGMAELGDCSWMRVVRVSDDRHRR